MKKLTAVSLVAVSLALIGVGCKPAAKPVSQTPTPPPHVAEQPTTPPPAQKMRNPSTLKPGDSFMGWAVVKVTDLQGNGAATTESYSVSLKGPKTVTGTWHYFKDDGLYDTFIMVFKPTGAAEDAFPGENGLGILLANKMEVLSEFNINGEAEASGTATIVIDDYNFQSNSEGYAAANIMKLVSKK